MARARMAPVFIMESTMNSIIRTAVLGAAAGLVTFPTAAFAESPLADAPSFTMSIGAGTSASSIGYLIDPEQSIGGSFNNRPSLNNRIGVTFSKWVLFASLGRDSVAQSVGGESVSASVLNGGMGARFYMKPLRVKKATPYIMAQAFTTVAALDTGNDGLDDRASNTQTVGLLPAFGGEYAFSDGLSVSGETGIAYSRSMYDDGDDVLEVSATAFSSAVYLNIYF